MCQYFSSTEDHCSQVKIQTAKKAFENSMHHHGTMKTIGKGHLSNRYFSVQEAFYHILPKLKLMRIFPAVYFVDKNIPEEIVQVLLSEKATLYIDCSMERPNATFCNRKYCVLNHFCYAEFLVYYTLENKSTKTCEYPPELDDNFIENKHEECSYLKKIKLVISISTLRCQIARQILRYHLPNKLLTPEIFAHHVLLLFYLFRDEKQFFSGFLPFYQNKLREKEAQDVINVNKTKFEPYGDLVDQNVIDNQDPHNQIENGETPGPEYPNESNQKKLPDDEIAEGISSLSLKQRELSNVLHT